MVETKATHAWEEAWRAFKPLLAMVGFEGRYLGLAVYHPGDDDLAALAVSEIEAAMPEWRAAQARKRAADKLYYERMFAEMRERDRLRALRDAEKAKALAERPARVRGELAALKVVCGSCSRSTRSSRSSFTPPATG